MKATQVQTKGEKETENEWLLSSLAIPVASSCVTQEVNSRSSTKVAARESGLLRAAVNGETTGGRPTDDGRRAIQIQPPAGAAEKGRREDSVEGQRRRGERRERKAALVSAPSLDSREGKVIRPAGIKRGRQEGRQAGVLGLPRLCRGLPSFSTCPHPSPGIFMRSLPLSMEEDGLFICIVSHSGGRYSGVQPGDKVAGPACTPLPQSSRV